MRHIRKPFNRDMVLALLKGKTQTRRKGKLDAHPGDIIAVTEAWWSYGLWLIDETTGKSVWCKNPCVKPLYAADYPEGWKPAPVDNEPGKWRKMPGMHLPLKDTRLFLEVERSWRGPLQDMSPADAVAEGITMHYRGGRWQDYQGLIDSSWFAGPNAEIRSYASLWDSINGKGDFAWRFNPEVSCYQFKILKDYKI